jgi:hypothetical protein
MARSRQSRIRMRDASGRFTRTITKKTSVRRKRRLKRSPEARAKGRAMAIINTVKATRKGSNKDVAKFLSKGKPKKTIKFSRQALFTTGAGLASITSFGLNVYRSNVTDA